MGHKCRGVIYTLVHTGSAELRSLITRLASHGAQFTGGRCHPCLADECRVSGLEPAGADHDLHRGSEPASDSYSLVPAEHGVVCAAGGDW